MMFRQKLKYESLTNNKMCSSTPTFPPKNLGCSSLFDAVHILRAIFIHAKNHVEEIEK